MIRYLSNAALLAVLAILPLAGCETQEPETPPPAVEPDGANDTGMDNGMNSGTDPGNQNAMPGNPSADGTTLPPAGSGANSTPPGSTQPGSTQPGGNQTGGSVEDEDVTEVQPNQ